MFVQNENTCSVRSTYHFLLANYVLYRSTIPLGFYLIYLPWKLWLGFGLD